MAQDKAADGSVERIIVTVHGIRTFGQWQERLAALIEAEDPDARIYNYHYGFFSVLAFLVPPLRAIRVRFFRRALQGIVGDNPHARITLVGHSFGTHMIGWAIARGFEDKRASFEQIILAGSVLRQDFDWQELIDKRIVKRVINDCGVDDGILILSQFGVLFTGMAGRLGFSGTTGVSLFNRYHRGGHSHYFVNEEGLADDTFMAEKWLPLIMGAAKPQPFDMRTTQGPMRGFLHWLIQNADGVKIAAMIAIGFFGWQQLYAGPRQAAEGERIARLRVIAMQQLGNDESVAQGVATLLAIARRNPDDRDALEIAMHWLPQLRDVGVILKGRGFPAFAEWNGRNLLILPHKTITIAGDLVESYGFSRDGKLLLTFDARAAVSVYAVDSGKRQLRVPTWLADKNLPRQSVDGSPIGGDHKTASGAIADMRATTIDDDYEAAYAAGLVAADAEDGIPALAPDSEVARMSFRESRDGRYLWGTGVTGATIAGDMRPVILLIDRKTLAYSLCAFSLRDVHLLEERRSVSFFAQAGYEGRYYEIARPQEGKACRYRSYDAAGRPVAVVPAIDALIKASNASDLPELAIAASAWSPPADASADDLYAAGLPTIVFPSLLSSPSIWSTVPMPLGDASSLGFESTRQLRGTRMLGEDEARIQRQLLRDYGATSRGKWVVDDIDYAVGMGAVGGPESGNPDRGTVVVSEAADNILTLVEGGGNHFTSTIYCRSRRLGMPIEFCGSLNLNGDSTSVAISSGNRYIAGADFAVAHRPGIIIHDIASKRELTIDRQPLGGTHAVAFDPTGTLVFAATPLGIYAYRLPGDGTARFERLYQVAGLAARSDEEEFIDAVIAVGTTQIYYLVPGGHLQAISRKTGDVEWVQEMPLGGSSIVLDSVSGQLAVYDQECVNLLHARTGARLTARFCPGTTPDSVMSEELSDPIRGVRFSDQHVAEIFSHKSLHRFDRIPRPKLPALKPVILRDRILGWLGFGKNHTSANDITMWRNRTGYDVRELPAAPLTELTVGDLGT